MIIVLNEWIFHDMWEENGAANRLEVERFLTALQNSDDRFVIPPHGAHGWNRKVYQLMDRARGNSNLSIVRRLFRSLFEDPRKAMRIPHEDMIPVPADILPKLPPEDIYLVEAYLSAGADMLVTTDHGLHGALADFGVVQCRLRDDFLAGYPPDA